MFVEVLDENDHIPLTTEPVYWVHVSENSPPRTPVVRITAIDGDRNSKLTYQLKAGNPQSLFDIDPNTGTLLLPSLIRLSIRLLPFMPSVWPAVVQSRENTNSRIAKRQLCFAGSIRNCVPLSALLLDTGESAMSFLFFFAR